MLAIAGGKGGCGKTTTALGVGRALARTGATPLVADADTDMPDLHVCADVPLEPGLAAVATGARVAAVAHPTRLPGVRAAPAAGVDGSALRAALDRLPAWPGPTLLDCPAGAGRDAARPLRAADRTLLVTTPARQCLRDTAKTAAMARTLDAPPLGAVVVRTAADASVTPDAVRSLLGCPLLGRVPRAEQPPLGADTVQSAYARVGKKVNKRNI